VAGHSASEDARERAFAPATAIVRGRRFQSEVAGTSPATTQGATQGD
jgi:hypothetical protein